MVANTKTKNNSMFQQTPQKSVLRLFGLRQACLLIALLSVAFAPIVYTLLAPQKAAAAVSSTINFQARLQGSTGVIVADGNYNVEFKLYNASSSSGSSQGSCTGDSNCLWTETRVGSDQVRVANGYLTVNLGSVTPFGSLDWNQQLWLTMNIGGTGSPSWDGEMNPRLLLTGVPYAFQAGELGNGTNRATFDASGNLQFQQASTIKELSAGSGTALTVQGGAATSGTNIGGNLVLQGGAGASTGASGSVLVKPAGNDSAAAFQVQNASSQALVTADTVNGRVTFGTAGTLAGKITLYSGTASNTNTITITTGNTASSYTLTLPTAVGSSGDCLKASNGTGSLTWGTCGGAGGVTLQASTPGTADTGNFNVSGTGIAGILQASTDSSTTASLLVGSGANVASFLSVSTRALFGYDGSNVVVQGTASKGIKFNVNNSTFGSGTAVTIDTSGNVGIGAASGGRTLDVDGGTLTVGTATTYAFGVGNALQGDFTIGSDASNVYLQSWNSKPLEINGQGNNIYLVPNGGNVGVGTTSTSYPLDVNGIIRSNAGVIATGDDNGGSGGQQRLIGGSYGFIWRNDGSNLYLLQTASGDQYGTWSSKRQIIIPTNSDNIYFSDNGGNVGIGTTSVGHTLTVSKSVSGGKVVGFDNLSTSNSTTTGILELRGGWASGTANSRYIQFYDSATTDTNGIGEGSVDARNGGVTYNTSTADFGEYFTTLDPIEYGDIAVGSTVNGVYGVTKATTQNANIVGVLSNTAGFVGNAKYAADGTEVTENRDVVGLMGQIKTHVSTANGAIHVGDPITVSAIPGYGAKAVSAGQIVGHAMQDFDPAAGSPTTACPSGGATGVQCGTITVLVGVSWYDPTTAMASNLQGANFASLNITGNLSTYQLTVTNDAIFKANITVEGHIITGGNTPLTNPRRAAGLDATGHKQGVCTLAGNDTSGTLSLTAGSDNLTSGAQCTITFAKPFDHAPRPVLSATNKAGAKIGIYAQTSTSQMTIYFSQAPLAGQQYSFNYWNPQ